MNFNARVDVNCGRKDGRMDGRMDGLTDGRMDGKAGATKTMLFSYCLYKNTATVLHKTESALFAFHECALCFLSMVLCPPNFGEVEGAYCFGPARPSVRPSVCPSVPYTLAAEILKNRLC